MTMTAEHGVHLRGAVRRGRARRAAPTPSAAARRLPARRVVCGAEFFPSCRQRRKRERLAREATGRADDWRGVRGRGLTDLQNHKRSPVPEGAHIFAENELRAIPPAVEGAGRRGSRGNECVDAPHPRVIW